MGLSFWGGDEMRCKRIFFYIKKWLKDGNSVGGMHVEQR